MINLNFDDVLIQPAWITDVKSRSEVNLEVEINGWKGIPIFVANMHSIATFSMARVTQQYKMVTCLSKFIDYDGLEVEIADGYIDPEYIALSFGIMDLDEMDKIVQRFPKVRFLCLDVANGGMKSFIWFTEAVRKRYKDRILIGGNIANPDTMYWLNQNLDIIKFGIGGGSHCLTRDKTGIGFPQFGLNVAVNSNEHRNRYNYIMSDGGCVKPGDVCKVFATGTSAVMIGGMFAGHNECDNISYGMSSTKAQKDHYGEINSYRTSEGSVKNLPNRGPVKDTIEDLLGGLRSMCSYVNIKNLADLRYKDNRPTFIETTQQRNKSLDKYDISN